MMFIRLVSICLVLSGAASAQEVASAPGADLRWLDKVSGATSDIEITIGQTLPFGRLQVSLSDCRYPVEDPSSNAYAHLVVSVPGDSAPPLFDGWMIASSPALSALDDPRYDIWLLRCKTP